ITQRELGCPKRSRQVCRGQYCEHQPRLERIEAAPVLEIQRQDEEERRLAAPERELGQESAVERALLEQREVQQRRTASPTEPLLVPDKGTQEERRGGQAQPAPDRPPGLAAFDERQQHGGQRGCQ